MSERGGRVVVWLIFCQHRLRLYSNLLYQDGGAYGRLDDSRIL